MKPTIEFEKEGKPTTISYNVPEPTSYPGQNVIELDIPSDWFIAAATKKPVGNFDNASSATVGFFIKPLEFIEIKPFYHAVAITKPITGVK